MEELEVFARLVGLIYDAALDSGLWPKALEQACAFVQGCSGVLFFRSVESPSISLFHSWGEDPYFLKLYQEKYAQIDPFFPAALFYDVGHVHTVNDLIPIEEFCTTRLYKEWVYPQGQLDAIRANLERTATGAAALIIRRRKSDGLFNADAKSRFSLIVPHVRRAIGIGKVVEFHRASEKALAETLDGLDAAVLLVASDGRLVHLNTAGTTMLTAANVLRAPRGRLTAFDPRANTELQEAITGAARGDAGLGVKGIAISLVADERTSQVAHVLSLTSGTRRVLLQGQAVAAVFVRSTTFATPAPLEIVAQLYGLTAGEVRVLASLAASSSVASMARMLGIGEATVKSHLHRLFGKTGAKRQADLVKLLAKHGTL